MKYYDVKHKDGVFRIKAMHGEKNLRRVFAKAFHYMHKNKPIPIIEQIIPVELGVARELLCFFERHQTHSTFSGHRRHKYEKTHCIHCGTHGIHKLD